MYARLFFSQRNGRSHHPVARKSAPITGEISNEGSELSYVSYSDRYITDCSIASPSSDDSRICGTTPRGRRSPYIGISSREHSLYQARRRGSDGSVVRILDVVDALQRLSSSNNQAASLPIGQDVLAIDIRNEETHPPVDPQGEPAGPVTPSRSLPNAMGVQGVDSPTRTHTSANRHSRGPLIREIYDTALRVEGPHFLTDPHSHADAENIAVDAPGHSVDGTATPAHDPMREDTRPPPVDSRAPPVARLRRVHVRGVFVIGHGAPIEIDEGIEVHLRDGTDGRIDFII